MINYKFACYGGYLLFFLSYILYFMALSTNLFEITAENEAISAFVQNLNYKFIDAINELSVTKKYFPMVLIIIYTYVIPIIKLLFGIICLLQPFLLKYLNNCRYNRFSKIDNENKNKGLKDRHVEIKPSFVESFLYFSTVDLKALNVVRFISKFQLTDSFMAMIMFTILMDNYILLTVSTAGYYFWGYCIGTLIAVQIISICQEQVSKNMIYNSKTYEYSINYNDYNKNSGRSKRLDIQIFFSSSYMIFLTLIFIVFYIFYFFSYSFSTDINVLDYRLALISSSLKGSDVLDKLSRSDYIFNGFLTTLIFVFVLPIIHICLSSLVYIYFAYCFVKDADYKNSLLDIPKMDKYKEEVDFKPSNFVNFVSKRANNLINRYDLLLYKYTKRSPIILKLLKMIDHLGDWCMMEVYCVATLTAYFTLNGMPSIDATLPFIDQKSNFYYMLLLGVTGFLLTNNFSMFALRVVKLHEKSFDEYNQQFKLLDGKDIELKEGTKVVDNNENINNTPNSISMKEKTIILSTDSYVPFYAHLWVYLSIILACLIGTIVATSVLSIPRQELTVEIFDEIFGQNVPIFNQFLKGAPFSLGNCDPEINEVPKLREKYQANSSLYEYTGNFLSGMDPPIPSEMFSCQSLINVVEKQDAACENYFERLPYCKYPVDSLLTVGAKVEVPVLGMITPTIYLYETFGLSTSYFEYINLDVIPDNRIRLSTRVRIPDFDIHFALNLFGTGIADNTTNHCCVDTQYLDIEIAFKCNGNDHSDDSKNLLYDIEILKFYIHEFYLYSSVFFPFNFEPSVTSIDLSNVNPMTFLSLFSTNNNNLAPLLSSLIPSLVSPIINNFSFELFGQEMKILDLVSEFIKMNTQEPYTCPVYINEDSENQNVSLEPNRLLKDLSSLVKNSTISKRDFNSKNIFSEIDYNSFSKSIYSAIQEYLSLNENQESIEKYHNLFIEQLKPYRLKI